MSEETFQENETLVDRVSCSRCDLIYSVEEGHTQAECDDHLAELSVPPVPGVEVGYRRLAKNEYLENLTANVTADVQAAPIPVLDHGYVRHVESWGKGDYGELEAGIIEAARQSTQGSFRGWETDEKLLRFMYSNKHSTPFEFAGMVIEIQAPIFVFREHHRHRTQSYNEMSSRYAPLPNLNYLPTLDRTMIDPGKNKQAQGISGTELTTFGAQKWLDLVDAFYTQAEKTYQLGLTAGVPKELARIILPVGRYSRMRATANLRNWLAFLTLRMDPAAQYEIRMFANAIGQIVAHQFPHTWRLFDYVQNKSEK